MKGLAAKNCEGEFEQASMSIKTSIELSCFFKGGSVFLNLCEILVAIVFGHEIAVFGLPEQCSIFHFPSSVRLFVTGVTSQLSSIMMI